MIYFQLVLSRLQALNSKLHRNDQDQKVLEEILANGEEYEKANLLQLMTSKLFLSMKKTIVLTNTVIAISVHFSDVMLCRLCCWIEEFTFLGFLSWIT